MKCSICSKEIIGFGNNASPFNNERCCDDCNENVLLPLRMYLSGLCKKQILVLKPDNTLKFVDVKGKEVDLKTLQNEVEGYIELYPKSDKNFYFIINEEGKLRKLKQNALAMNIFRIKAVGNVVICPKRLFS